MFIHLFVSFILLHQVACDVSCYVCPEENNIFEYNIIAENVPTQLNNCTVETEQVYCLVDIAWKQSPTIETSIRLRGFNPYPKSNFLPHTVEITAYTPSDPNQFEVEVKHFLRYTCRTDRCNQPAIFKPLLESLIWNDKLDELEYLLKSNGTFDGRWCLSFSNSTDPPFTVNLTECKQCRNHVIDKNKWKTVKAFCATPIYPQNRLGHEVTFDLDDGTRSDMWRIDCQTPDCNSISNINQIDEKSKIDFDINKFLKSTSTGLSITYSTNINTVILIVFLVLFAQVF